MCALSLSRQENTYLSNQKAKCVSILFTTSPEVRRSDDSRFKQLISTGLKSDGTSNCSSPQGGGG